MKKLHISEVRTTLKTTLGSGDPHSFSVVYYDSMGDLKLFIESDYGNFITIFCFDPLVAVEKELPFVVYSKPYYDAGITQILCHVPDGNNFFEEDFSKLNKLLSLGETKDFIFNK